MKKQFQILAATFITVAFISCSKERVETPEPTLSNNQEISTTRGGGGFDPNNPLAANLEGRFEFDGNLKEKYGKLPNGVTTSRAAAKFTADRHGNEQKALLFDGHYGVDLSSVPQQNNTSISVWLHVGTTSPGDPLEEIELIEQNNVVYGIGPTISYRFTAGIGFWDSPEASYDLMGGVLLSNNSKTHTEYETNIEGWYHVVVTYDGNDIQLYINGQLTGTKNFPGTINKSRQKKQLAYASLSKDYWLGSMDDLRFYSHTLSASEVQKIFNE